MNEQMPYKEKTNISNEFNIRVILDVLLSQWYWFVLSVLVCMAMAYLYMQTVHTVYERQAIVLLKEQIKTEDAFIEKQLFNRSSNVNNEILIFKSRTLMEEVVRRLSLNVEYSMDQGFKRTVLFTESPVAVVFPDSVPEGQLNFIITPANREQFFLIGAMDENEKEQMTEGHFGQKMNFLGVEITINKTTEFSDKWFHIPVEVNYVPIKSAVSACLSGLDVKRADNDASLLALNYLDTNASRGDAILNTLINVYNDEALYDRNLVIQHTAVFIDERLDLINAELGEVDGDIESFKKKNGLTNISSEAGIYLSNQGRYEQEEVMLTNQIELAGMIRDHLRDPMKEGQLLPTNSGIMDTGVEGMIGEYNRTLLVYNKLKRNADDRSPVVEELNVNLVALRNTIVKILDNLQRGLNLKLKDSNRQQQIVRGRISTIPTQEKYLLTVERQQKIKEELYLYLLNKREENALSLATAESNLRVIDPAYGLGVVGTDRMVILLAALLVGLAIPGLFFYLQPILDVTVRGRKDIADNLTIPFLGEVPHSQKKDGETIVSEGKRDIVSEAFRIVRTNMDFMLDKSKTSQVIALTSANPGAGKSFVSLNLAISLALTGKRTILLEMDIRKGSARGAKGEVVPGITLYLSGKTDQVDQLIHPCSDYAGLDVITSGPIPPNPAELLLSPRLDEIIRLLREQYEYILIDTVPYGMVADVQIISRVADLCIYVIREKVMDRRQLPEVESLFTSGKLPNMSVLLNDTRYKHAGYGYGFGYYGHYGYGSSYYGYGSKQNKNI